MVNKIYKELPDVLTNYIFFLAKVLLIQSVWRKNRRSNGNIKIGSRVLMTWRKNPITGIKWKNMYGTIDRIGMDYGYHYTYRIAAIISVSKHRYYYYKNSPSFYSPSRVIMLDPWNT